jgi:hypothetical protein
MELKTLNFGVPARGLDGQPVVPEQPLAGRLAVALANAATPDGDTALKFWTWACTLHKHAGGEPLALDPADADKLQRFVATHPEFSAAYKAQLLGVFREK